MIENFKTFQKQHKLFEGIKPLRNDESYYTDSINSLYKDCDHSDEKLLRTLIELCNSRYVEYEYQGKHRYRTKEVYVKKFLDQRNVYSTGVVFVTENGTHNHIQTNIRIDFVLPEKKIIPDIDPYGEENWES